MADGSGAGPAVAGSTVTPEQTVLRSQPWWQGVSTLHGVGNTTLPPVNIADGAVQWRLRWSCQTGRLLVQVPDRPRPLVDAACPGSDTSYATRTGPTTLEVKAEGQWQLQVDQQVDVPLEEPPLPAMTAPGTVAVAADSFYRIDQVGTGRLTLYRLANGTYALRFDNFFVTANSDLELRLSPLVAPRTTEQFLSAPSVRVAPLDVTAGAMNFALPKEVDPAKYRSLVIWCERLRTAYAAASLTPVGS